MSSEAATPVLDPERLERYSRQIRLPDFDPAIQQRLLDAHALIIGLGGLGSPAALYLAAAGLGHLMLVDFDRVELSNLHRQIVHGVADLGRSKAEWARARLLELDPALDVQSVNGHLDGDALLEAVRRADVVLDCSDNFETRFLLNRACHQCRTPLVSGAALRYEGQVAVFDFRHPDSPCYRCLYQDEGDLGESCSQLGILGPVVGIISCVQALEAIKLLCGLGDTLCGRLAFLDGWAMEWRTILLRKDPGCPVCGGAGSALTRSRSAEAPS
jgi:adenylyltransferase/sulfurtransferase